MWFYYIAVSRADNTLIKLFQQFCLGLYQVCYLQRMQRSFSKNIVSNKCQTVFNQHPFEENKIK